MANSLSTSVERNGVDTELWGWDTVYKPLGKSLESSGRKVSTANKAYA